MEEASSDAWIQCDSCKKWRIVPQARLALAIHERSANIWPFGHLAIWGPNMREIQQRKARANVALLSFLLWDLPHCWPPTCISPHIIDSHAGCRPSPQNQTKHTLFRGSRGRDAFPQSERAAVNARGAPGLAAYVCRGPPRTPRVVPRRVALAHGHAQSESAGPKQIVAAGRSYTGRPHCQNLFGSGTHSIALSHCCCAGRDVAPQPSGGDSPPSPAARPACAR